jgi:hypothetical protein
MTSEPTIFAGCLLAATIFMLGSIGYAMTAKAFGVRLWGYRIAVSLLTVTGGTLLATSMLKPELVGRSGYFLGAVMFMIAGWLTSPIRKFKETAAASDPLEALCRLPTRLDR